jgi:EF hand
MKNIILVGIMAAAFIAGCASTPPPNDEFSRIDTDSDGFITWEEYKVFRPEAKRTGFLKSDQNYDNKLDVGEWRLGVGSTF